MKPLLTQLTNQQIHDLCRGLDQQIEFYLKLTRREVTNELEEGLRVLLNILPGNTEAYKKLDKKFEEPFGY